jgi:hypothetical protein
MAADAHGTDGRNAVTLSDDEHLRSHAIGHHGAAETAHDSETACPEPLLLKPR